MKKAILNKFSAIFFTIFIQLFSRTITSAQNSNALHFDGANDLIYIGNNALLNPPHITVQAWIKADYAGAFRGVITKRNCCTGTTEQWAMQTNNGKIAFGVNFSGTGETFLTDPNFVPVGEWAQFTGTYNGTTVKLYKNGNLVDSVNVSGGDIWSLPWNVYIGDRDGGNDPWPGAIDEVRIWNRALTQQEILANMNCHLSGNEPGLIAYYDFNQGVAGGNNAGVTTLPDLTSNGLNGTLQNFALSGSNSNWVVSPFTDLSVSINSQPTNTLLPVGDTAKFIVSSSNNPVSFQWQTDSAGSGFHNISDGGQYIGTSNDTLLVNSVTPDNNNQLFRCAVSSAGFCSDTSTVALLQVTGVLGVSLINFNAVKEDKKVSLKWVVENEADLSLYSIERSRNGNNFYPIGNIAAINRDDRHLYAFTDTFPFPGVNFYRLKITEINGSYYYSPIRKVDFESSSLITIYQNPTGSIIQIATDTPGEFEIGIMDMNGRQMRPKERFIGSKQIDLSAVPSGIYFVEIYYISSGKKIAKKIVKMN